MTQHREWPNEPINLLVGGTPCQSFSVAGLRKGLDDPRGNLMLTYGAIARQYRPTWLVWENVPGVLSSNRGKDFGAFLGMLAELGYGFAYRILDAQYFGVAQRRRRVFVIGHLGNWQRAAAVLFERESLSGNPAPSREKGEETAKWVTAGVGKRYDPKTETLPVAFDWQSGGDARGLDPKETAMLQRNQVPAVATATQVRRLTPVECERLQGFPDGYTNIPWRNKPDSPDGPRYKALGNSMAVPVMHWIGKRISEVENAQKRQTP